MRYFGRSWLETYAHTYIAIDNLKVVSFEDALTFSHWYNDSYVYSSNGATWLILFSVSPFYTPQINYADLNIFKIAQNTTAFTKGLNLLPIKAMITSTPDEVEMPSYPPVSRVAYAYNNCTQVLIPYTISSGPGLYTANFAVTFKLYETTLLGIFPVNQATIKFNTTLSVPVG